MPKAMVNMPHRMEPHVMRRFLEPMRSESVPKKSAEKVVAVAEQMVMAVTTPSCAPKSE